jgi:hypothetical protein
VNAFSRSAEAQDKAVDASLEQTQLLSNAIAMLLAELRNAESARTEAARTETAAATEAARRPYKARTAVRASDPGLQASLWNDTEKRDEGEGAPQKTRG